MPVLKAVIVLEVDGVAVPGFPYSRRITLDEGQGFDFIKADGVASALPVDQIAAVLKVLTVRADQVVTIALGKITLNPGGILLVVDADLGTGAQATVANASGANAQVKGYGAGS